MPIDLMRIDERRMEQLTMQELHALIWVHDQLEAQVLSYNQGEVFDNTADAVVDGDEWPVCGTTCCIGGWLWLKLNILDTERKSLKLEDREQLSGFVNAFGSGTNYIRHPGIQSLFWGNTNQRTAPEEGAQAIANYLYGDNIPWHFYSDRE